jgi:hypothetical protein
LKAGVCEVNCREFDDRITPAVDRVLHGDEWNGFGAHALECPGCMHAYESERSIKRFIGDHVTMVPLPAPLLATLQSTIRSEGTLTSAVLRWLQTLLRDSLSLRVSLALGALGIAASGFILHPLAPGTPASREVNDVLTESRDTYAGILNGDVKLQIETTESSTLHTFFFRKTDFPLHVPAIRHYHPVGALMDDHGGVPCAQIVYAGEGIVVCVHQTCWETVRDGRLLSLPERALDVLRYGGTYSEEEEGGRSVVVWTDGRTLSIAVASMPSQQLLGDLASVTTLPVSPP